VGYLDDGPLLTTNIDALASHSGKPTDHQRGELTDGEAFASNICSAHRSMWCAIAWSARCCSSVSLAMLDAAARRTML
jgi:hypothetical protein